MQYYPDNSEWRENLKRDVAEIEESTKKASSAVTLEQMSYNAPSDEDIRRWATAEANEEYNKDKRELEEKTDASKKQLYERQEGYRGALDNAQRELKGSYDSATQAADNDAIKRGLARSSVAALNRAEIESEYLRLNADIAKTYGKKINELDDEISLTDRKFQTALADFNLGFAQRLAKKIEEMTAERDKKIAEVTKFNNDVLVKQAKLDADRDSAATNVSSQTYQAIYEKMDEYLATLDPAAARMEVKNHSFYQDHLSNYYYGKLYNKYGRK